MTITKLGHSCVLVETTDRIALFDPGVWSDKEKILSIEHIDRLIYTHEHPDHFDIEILKELVSKHPNLQVVCHETIEHLIREGGVDVVVRSQTACSVPFTSDHEQLPVPGATAPSQRGYHFKEVFTHPGDSQHFEETKVVLAMPFIGPWGKTGDSINKVLELSPTYVLPIHDWHYTEDAKDWLQSMLKNVLEPEGIVVLENSIGKKLEIDV